MATVTIKNAPPALMIRGRFGLPNELGEFWLGWSELGDFLPQAGIYKKRKCNDGMRPIKFRFYQGSNPRTTFQRERRAFFSQGVAIYHALDDSTQLAYRRTGAKVGRTGFNIFMSEYLRGMHGGFSELGEFGLGLSQLGAVDNLP